MEIRVKVLGMKILKTWIYGGAYKYSTHENLVQAVKAGPDTKSHDGPGAEYFKLVRIEPAEVERQVGLAKIEREIERFEDVIIKDMATEKLNRARLAELKTERAGLGILPT